MVLLHRSSKGMGLRVADGVVWVDLCPYDDKLLHGIIRAHSRRSAQVPTQKVISPMWANMGKVCDGISNRRPKQAQHTQASPAEPRQAQQTQASPADQGKPSKPKQAQQTQARMTFLSL